MSNLSMIVAMDYICLLALNFAGFDVMKGLKIEKRTLECHSSLTDATAELGLNWEAVFFDK